MHYCSLKHGKDEISIDMQKGQLGRTLVAILQQFKSCKFKIQTYDTFVFIHMGLL